MKLKEKYESAGLSTDSKARRRLNVTGKRANISADQLERGVTIEELESIGVPVYRYQTQVTIHGTLPGLSQERVAGFKCLFQNGNGTIGIRYVAIDAEKKKLIDKACRATESRFRGSFNSQGFTLFLSATTKEDILQEYHGFPRDLVHGSIYAGALMFGGYGLFVEIGCVDAGKVGDLLTYLTGKGAAECQKAIDAKEAEREERNRAYDVEAKANREAREKARVELESRILEAVKGRKPLRAFPVPGNVEIATGFDEAGQVKFKRVEFAKRGPLLCCKRAGESKFSRYVRQYDKALQAGRVFPVEAPEPDSKLKPEIEPKGGLVQEIAREVEWQGVEVYETRKGKEKPLLTGIPGNGFWLLWKHDKAQIKALGVTIYAEKSEGTGVFRTVRGKSFEVKRKQWIVQAWKPEAFGFTPPAVSSSRGADCPF